MSTTLDAVGLQVWSGSLLMADYLLCQRERLQDSLVLELGAGTGLVSLTAALTAQCVFCTGVCVAVYINKICILNYRGAINICVVFIYASRYQIA